MEATILQALNQSASIPLNLVITSATDWKQFGISIVLGLFGSLFVFFYLWQYVGRDIFSKLVSYKILYGIKKATGRNVVLIKHTANELFNVSMIDQKTMEKMISSLNKFNGKPFDLILYTPGGDIFSAKYISRILQNYPSETRAFIPIYSMSGGTFLALSTDKLFLGRNACLGPVDPQISSLFKYGSAKQWDQIVKFKGKKAEDASISFALIGKQYTKSIYNDMYGLISKKLSEDKARKFSKFLTSGDIEHAYPITLDILKSYNYPAELMSKDLEIKLSKVMTSSISDGVYTL